METLELTVGPYRYSALADGPADGDLVLLLHGFPETSYEWRAPTRRRSAAPGTARSRPTSVGTRAGARPVDVADYHVDHLVRDVLGFADALGAERFHLVGHDWGGFVAWYAGGRHGERLRSLCVVSTPASHTVPRRDEGRAGATSASGRATCSGSARPTPRRPSSPTTPRCSTRSTPSIRPTPRPSTAACSPPTAAPRSPAGSTGTAPTTSRAAIGPITVPTMYVWSTADVALGREAAEGTAAEVAGPYRFEVLPDVSHWIPEVAADALDRAAPGAPLHRGVRLPEVAPRRCGKMPPGTKRPMW